MEEIPKLTENEMREEVEAYLVSKKFIGQILKVEQFFDKKNPNSIQIKFTARGHYENDAENTKNGEVIQEILILKNLKFIDIKKPKSENTENKHNIYVR
jgi:hypothetical protein